MKTIQDLIKSLDGIVGKTQIILDIRLGNHNLVAKKFENSYAIEDDVAKKYIITRKKLHAEKELKKKNLLKQK